jgi:hypothetical protein
MLAQKVFYRLEALRIQWAIPYGFSMYTSFKKLGKYICQSSNEIFAFTDKEKVRFPTF